ncbi:MAG: hypothetical protein LBC88_02185 [Spirochaetaceae bacterium]|jgi:hypothetical protein|nr:hypothetical protein [Spirochaetaceae bacterium]
MKLLKKIYVLSIIFALVFAACGNGETIGETKTGRLKIKNESFTELTGVMWQGVSFANNSYENSIKTGTNVTQHTGAGAGYIFFKRKLSPISARTSDIVIVEEGGEVEFTFTDNTVITEVNNTGNSGTLGALENTVVFFDDAEGEMQQYYARQVFAGYYDWDTPLNNNVTPGYGSVNISAVKNGQRSIAVGGQNTAKLHLRLDLAKPAALSFWVANRRRNGISGAAAFSINGAVQETWSTDLDWSFKTFPLAVGQNDIVWEKTDGYYPDPQTYYYLSLDDMVIYYTE